MSRNMVLQGNRLHPTQKPINVLRPLIESFCPIGGLVLDPFCGSGSTRVAATHAGRECIGIELDANHHRTASLQLHSTQHARFDVMVPDRAA
jgi:DNA modification methylase